jgi:hypothetical protein
MYGVDPLYSLQALNKVTREKLLTAWLWPSAEPGTSPVSHCYWILVMPRGKFFHERYGSNVRPDEACCFHCPGARCMFRILFSILLHN